MPLDKLKDSLAVLLAYVYCYDLRGGRVETAFKEDRQGLGITKRNKKRFEAQQMMVQLNALAHNLIVWSRRWLAQSCVKFHRMGILRMARDVFHLAGLVHFHHNGRIKRIISAAAHRTDAGSVLRGGRGLAAPVRQAINQGFQWRLGDRTSQAPNDN